MKKCFSYSHNMEATGEIIDHHHGKQEHYKCKDCGYVVAVFLKEEEDDD